MLVHCLCCAKSPGKRQGYPVHQGMCCVVSTPSLVHQCLAVQSMAAVVYAAGWGLCGSGCHCMLVPMLSMM